MGIGGELFLALILTAFISFATVFAWCSTHWRK
jgi:hypothetical protein